MDNQTFNPSEAAKAQKEYCQKTKSPHFAPYSGNCYSCKKNIYERKEHTGRNFFTNEAGSYTTGISVKKAGKELVTGCPHCNRSYCD